MCYVTKLAVTALGTRQNNVLCSSKCGPGKDSRFHGVLQKFSHFLRLHCLSGQRGDRVPLHLLQHPRVDKVLGDSAHATPSTTSIRALPPRCQRRLRVQITSADNMDMLFCDVTPRSVPVPRRAQGVPPSARGWTHGRPSHPTTGRTTARSFTPRFTASRYSV